MRKKRDLFGELVEGFDALADQRAGKRTLRTHVLKAKPAPKITARELAKLRQEMNLSRGLFAQYLRTNVRTLENWEQGRAKPNAQAALLIRWCSDSLTPYADSRRSEVPDQRFSGLTLWDFCGTQQCLSLLSRDKCNRCPASSVS